VRAILFTCAEAALEPHQTAPRARIPPLSAFPARAAHQACSSDHVQDSIAYRHSAGHRKDPSGARPTPSKRSRMDRVAPNTQPSATYAVVGACRCALRSTLWRSRGHFKGSRHADAANVVRGLQGSLLRRLARRRRCLHRNAPPRRECARPEAPVSFVRRFCVSSAIDLGIRPGTTIWRSVCV